MKPVPSPASAPSTISPAEMIPAETTERAASVRMPSALFSR